MKKDFVHLVYMLIVLVVAGAMEELVPKIFNVGLPVLLSAAAYSALRRTPVEALLFALAAGGMEDSLSSLPFATSIGFFVAQFALLRLFKLPLAAAIPFFALYQFWVWMWLGSRHSGGLWLRILSSIPVGALTLALVCLAMRWLDGKAAMNEK